MTTDLPETVTIDGETFVIADVARDPRRLLELYADRCRDLEFEYTERMAAEVARDAWYEVATYHADHDAGCAIVPGHSETCTCGYSALLSKAFRFDSERDTPPTPYARLVALGRAALAYERHRGTPAGRDLRAAYMAALAACEAE